MASYRVEASVPVNVKISSKEIVKILKEEKVKIHGGFDRYVELGKLYEDNYEETEVFIRELSKEELELDFAVNKMINYFYTLGVD